MADKTSQTRLSKEVLAPQNPYSGLGVVLVASLAMFMAMASSAFVIRARMARTCPANAPGYETRMPAAVEWHANTPDADAECGMPLYRANPDGSVSVHFKVCADGDAPPAGVQSLDDLHLAPPALTGAVEIRPAR